MILPSLLAIPIVSIPVHSRLFLRCICFCRESSEYSDWAADGGVDLQPPKRSSRPSKKKKVSSSEEEEEKGSQAGTSADTRSKKKKKPPPKKKKKVGLYK